MSDPTEVLCRRCGTANVAGDQFCGSCGAFLEWEGEAVGDAASEPGQAGVGIGPGADVAVPAVGWVAPDEPAAPDAAATPPFPGSSATPAGPSVDTSALVRCPACGIANRTGRTFCQSCGATLPADARVDVGAATAAWVASGAPKPTPVAPSAPATGSTAAGAQAKPTAAKETQGSGGIPGWVIAMVALGLLVGVGAVVIPQLLAPEVPSGATSAPSLPPQITQTPTLAPTPAPTPEPPSALVLLGATASSVVGNREKFAPDKAIDGDPRTSWQEGAAQEAGQWLEVEFAPARVHALVIWNGYQESEASYFANRRLRDVRITFDAGPPIETRLEDTMEPITVEVAGVDRATRMRIEIVTTYDPRRTDYPGSPFDDCALSEVQVIGVSVP